jgi:ABC-type nitrate/sulfonate/bicarbonate transport system substrate-binding protein
VLFSYLSALAGEPLRISVTRMPVSAPIFVAKERGLFKQAGLEIEVREYELGKTALEDLNAGRLDVAFAAVTPVVYSCMAGQNFKIIATAATSPNMAALAGRKDLGIQKVADIRGKRVGLIRGTSSEFFFDTLRVLNRVPKDSVVVENRTIKGLLDGLQDGSLDLVSIWEPQVQTVRLALTNRLVLFYGDGLYTFSWNMVTLPDTISKRRGDLEKFVSVLFQAADLVASNPDAMAAELTQRLGPLGRDITIGFKETRFRPQLGQELLVQLEGEARWIINRDGLTNAAPNFLRWLDTSILKKAHASAVTVIQ